MKKNKKLQNVLGCMYIRNNVTLPLPGMIYSTIINDSISIKNIEMLASENYEERTITMCFSKPSLVGSRKLNLQSEKNLSALRNSNDSPFFNFFFVADVVIIKPLPSDKLLCLFNIKEKFIPDEDAFIDSYHIDKEKIKTEKEEYEEYLKDDSVDEKTEINNLFSNAYDIALKQNMNFFEKINDEESTHDAQAFVNFFNFCLSYLDYNEKEYENFMMDRNLLEKIKYITKLLQIRERIRTLESENEEILSESIKNYNKSIFRWTDKIEDLKGINYGLATRGLEAIDEYLTPGLKNSNSDEQDKENSAHSSISANDLEDIFPKLPDFDDDANVFMGHHKKEKYTGDPNSYYAKYSKNFSESKAKRYIDFINKLEESDEVKEEIAAEIYKIDNSSTLVGPDYNTSLDYLETCLKVPFGKYSSETFDSEQAKKVIEESHYGMKNVKKRIYEFLALRHISCDKTGAIICLVGPPGVGKTSIAAAIAKALGREYFRFSAGGVRDEAEFIGHRRTYVAAQPGKIIQGLIRTKTLNPVFLIDEVDKLSSNNFSRNSGDASSTLLNILDPEQNKKFTDLYLNFPIDLSRVLFILTANDISSLPTPLLDRMEIIDVPSYTTDEKIHIVKDFLIKKIITELNLGEKAKIAELKDKDIEHIINSYTHEAGVRGIKAELEKLIRAQIEDKFTPNKKTYTLYFNEKYQQKYLGVEKFDSSSHLKADTSGTSIGLAWTENGGCTLKIEIVKTDGKGDLKLTGQLGDVMKESANIAFTYLQSIVNDSKFFQKHDFHLHIPEGATPKDGPSAGITILCAFYSLYSGQTIREKLAMTGELSLSGDVLAIGGLKEKLYAAKMNGFANVLIPKKCEKDLKDIDEEILKDLNIILVKDAKEVLSFAFAKKNTDKKEDNKWQAIHSRG